MSAEPVAERGYFPVNLKRELVDLIDKAREPYGQSRDSFVAQAVIERLERLGVKPKK